MICCMRRVVPREQHGEYEAQVNSDAAEQRNGIQMNFARTGFIHHAVAQRQMTNRHGEAQRREQRDGEGDQFRVIETLRLYDFTLTRGLEARGIPSYDCDEPIKLINSSIFGRRFPRAPAHFGQARRLRAKFADGRSDGGRIVGIRSDAAAGFDDDARGVSIPPAQPRGLDAPLRESSTACWAPPHPRGRVSL